MKICNMSSFDKCLLRFEEDNEEPTLEEFARSGGMIIFNCFEMMLNQSDHQTLIDANTGFMFHLSCFRAEDHPELADLVIKERERRTAL